jgi:hypothetical protein
MKHFRKCQQQEVVDTLKRVTGVSLEDSQLSALYDILVVKGDHIQAEQFITRAVSSKYTCKKLLFNFLKQSLKIFQTILNIL